MNNVTHKPEKTQRGINNNAVKVKNLTVKFGDFIAVNNISFSVQKGEIFGFLGANGAGKTTTIRVLCGLLHPTMGEVRVGGISFLNEHNEMEIKAKVGYMSQKFTLYNDLTVEENLSFIASLRNLSHKNYIKRRDSILQFISFKEPLDTFVKNLPGGIKQQVSLAGSMLHDPEIIFLDEPTAGVTPAMRAKFWELIHQLADNGKTVFVTTHYMDEAEQCHRIALMRTGEIIALDSPNQLKISTFPDPVFEFIPRDNISYERIDAIGKYPELKFFEPYGHKFHGVFTKDPASEKLKQALEKEFWIQEITPTLEDVFIRRVEEHV